METIILVKRANKVYLIRMIHLDHITGWIGRRITDWIEQIDKTGEGHVV